MWKSIASVVPFFVVLAGSFSVIYAGKCYVPRDNDKKFCVSGHLEIDGCLLYADPEREVGDDDDTYLDNRKLHCATFEWQEKAAEWPAGTEETRTGKTKTKVEVCYYHENCRFIDHHVKGWICVKDLKRKRAHLEDRIVEDTSKPICVDLTVQVTPEL